MNCFFIAKAPDSDLAEEHLREVFSDVIPLVPGFSWFAGGGYDSLVKSATYSASMANEGHSDPA